MPNLKLQTSRALKVIPSNRTNIPMPRAITSGTATATLANKLVDATKDFIALGVQVGDIIYNTTTPNASMVTNVDSATVLSLNANYLTVGDKYTLYSGTNFSGSIEPCVLYAGASGNIEVVTAGGDNVVFKGLQAGTFIPVHVIKVIPSLTTVTDIIALW